MVTKSFGAKTNTAASTLSRAASNDSKAVFPIEKIPWLQSLTKCPDRRRLSRIALAAGNSSLEPPTKILCRMVTEGSCHSSDASQCIGALWVTLRRCQFQHLVGDCGYGAVSINAFGLVELLGN